MNIRHFFDNIDEKTIDRITEKYPPLSSDDKERLYAMSKNKYNSEKKENKNNYSEVMGVERYRKPVWQKMVSAVAAAVVVLGGIGGGVLLLGKSGETDPISDIEVLQPEYDYTAIATELTDKLLEMENTICYGDISYDEYDRKVIDIVCSDDSAQFESPCEAILYKVTDPRFTCRRDLYDELRSIFTKQHYDENDFSTATIFGFDLNFYLGSELSDYIVDGKIDIAENFDNDDESICYAVYCDINGELYVRQCDFELSEYTSDVIIKETGENSFTATRSYIGDFVIGDGTSNRCFDFVLENGEWKIDKVYFSDEESEDVTESEDEYDYTAIAQQLFDDYLEVESVIKWGDVSYDENDSITFYTYNSNDAEWADNNVGERTFCKVTDKRFSSCQDIYEMLRAITTTKCEPEENFMNADWFAQFNLSSFLGGDVSMFEVGEKIDINHEISDWRWPGYSINRSVFVEYNGELYVNRRYNETPEFTSDVIIKETGENSFTTTRKYKSPGYSVEEYCILEVVLENGEWKIDKVYISEEESEDVTESEGEYDYTAIATELSDKYLELENMVCYGGISYDENEMKSYTVYDSFDELELIFYKVTDPRFTCEQDFYDEIRSIHTNQRYPDDNFTYTTFFAGCNLDSCFGGELSEYAANGRIDLAANYGNGNGYSLLGVYCYYNGELYVTPFDYDYELAEYTSDVIIKETGENSFTATRKFKSQFNSVGDYYKVFEIVLENGEWKIDNVERVVSDEEAIGNAIASYVDTLIRSDTDKYGNIYENPDVVDFGFEIVGYNGENNCTARVILTDYDYVDIIELTAEIDIKEQKVINAEIIELQ